MFSILRNLSSGFVSIAKQPFRVADDAFLMPALSAFRQAVCEFKVKTVLRRRCRDCFLVKRQDRWYVICKTHPRHKLMQKQRKKKDSLQLTWAHQKRLREW